MRLFPKLVLAFSAVLFFVLAVHAYAPAVLPLDGETERPLLWIAAGAVTLGFLLYKKDPLPYFINKAWFCVCIFTVATLFDVVLELGHMQGGFITFLPLHLFTLYGAWMIVERESIEQEHVRRLWVVAVVAFLLSPLFNYG